MVCLEQHTLVAHGNCFSFRRFYDAISGRTIVLSLQVLRQFGGMLVSNFDASHVRTEETEEAVLLCIEILF